MEKHYVLSIDLGSSSCKTVILDQVGTVVAKASQEYPASFRENDGVDQNADHWWGSVVATIKQTVAQGDWNPSDIVAIGIDSQSSVMLPLDRDGVPLHPAITCSDKRAKAQRQFIEDAIGQETLTKINGNWNDMSNVAPKMMWFRDTYPDLYQKTDKIVSGAGFLVYRLTGVYSHNVSEGGLTQLFDIETGQWSKELIQGCGLDSDKLPPIYGCSDVVGTTTPQVSSLLGIPSGIPVIAGAMDVCACALGCGILETNDAFITGGTVTALGICSDFPLKNHALHVYHHIIPNLWCNVAGVDFGGGSFRWFRDKFLSHVPQSQAYAEMNRLALVSAPGADGLLFLASLTGQRCPQWDANMRGTFFGINPNHGLSSFLRAVMEGNAYGVRRIMDIMIENGGMLRQCTIAGGISQSDLWMEIFATILGKPLYRAYCGEDTALGNLVSASYGIGLIDDYRIDLPCRAMELCPPQPNDAHTYEKMYRTHCQLEQALKEPFAALAQTQR